MSKKIVFTIALATTLAFSGLTLSGSGAMAKSTVNGQSYKVFHPGQSLGDTRAAGRQARKNRRIKNRQRIRNQRIKNRQRNRNRRRHKNKISTGAAIGLGVAALIAIAATSKKHKNDRVYRHPSGYGTRRNAISQCLYRVERLTFRRGGDVVLRRVNKAKKKHGDWRISLRVRQLWNGGGANIINPYCRIRGNRIIKFRMG